MKKNIVQDVVPPKKSIRNVKLAPKKETSRVSKISSIEPETTEYREEEFTRPVPIQAPMKIEPVKKVETQPLETNTYKYEYKDTGTSSKKWLYISGFIFVLATAFGISALFKSSEIKVSPKQETKSISETFIAKKDAVAGLGFQTVSVSKDIEKTVKSTGEEKVDKKSQGRIIIYNNFSGQSQKLVATTRFQTPEGLIFRLVNPVTVPGKEVKDGKNVPGSIEVLVEADKPGISYNVGLKDFTIPGFKGDPKYTSIYARSKTEMTGGFSGMQKTVSKDVLDQVESEMKIALENSLKGDITAQIPSNFVSYPNGLIYEIEQTTQAPASSNDEVVLKKKGRATAVIFDKSAITKSVLGKVMPDVETETVKISNIDSLEWKPTNAFSSSDKEVSFTISGEAKFVWVFDENKFKEDLLGLSKKSAKIIIANYPAISEAWIETKPFWNQKIPLNPEKVTLINTANQ
jgi:hypothetical protein